ncbi:hypothetical protein [Rubrivirga marina]|uniref:Uncharacterized protein n=1 Tax=Rubrivirga marina TaxID=1196024 RepID=A0A271IV34_9BACT|nr:hypothetical protein [Rubrivirga marina]PAP75073.1 hypothetical protein BSZ37_00710 [Rubrivirga marina]
MTNRPTAALQRRPTHSVFPDFVRNRVDGFWAPDWVLRSHPGFTGKEDALGEVYAESASHENLYIQNGPSGLLVAGSLRNWAVAVGLLSADDPFGPDEVARVLAALDDLLEAPAGTVASGRLTKIELAGDLALPRPVGAYADASEDLPGTTPWRVGHRTAYHKADKFEVRLYDKVEEALDNGRPLPTAHVGAHVGRVEYVLHRGGVPRYLGHLKDEGGVVRAGVLADPEARDELAQVWAARVRDLSFRRVPHPAYTPENATDRIRWHGVQRILATGGLSAEIARIDADRRSDGLTAQQAKDQKETVRKWVLSPRYSSVSDLQAEFEAAVDAVARTYAT